MKLGSTAVAALLFAAAVSAADTTQKAPVSRSTATLEPAASAAKQPAGTLKRPAGNEAARHRDRAVSADDYRPLAPSTPGTGVQRAPAPQPRGARARVPAPARAVGPKAARMQDRTRLVKPGDPDR